MANAKKVSNLSVGALAVLNGMKETENAMEVVFTVNNLKAKGIEANPSHLKALESRGLVENVGDVLLSCECCGSKRKVKGHKLTEKGMGYTA